MTRPLVRQSCDMDNAMVLACPYVGFLPSLFCSVHGLNAMRGTSGLNAARFCVDLCVSLDATQHDKPEKRNYRSQSYAYSKISSRRVRSLPSRYSNTFECLCCTLDM
jgi:hypothetical protein